MARIKHTDFYGSVLRKLSSVMTLVWRFENNEKISNKQLNFILLNLELVADEIKEKLSEVHDE